jgi:hypothetical protein
MAKVDFVREVKPILEIRCVRCHGAETAMKHLRLNRRDRAMMVIVPKRPEESQLFLAARSGSMPLGGPQLSAVELETLRKWIAEGAHWPKNVELIAKNPFSANLMARSSDGARRASEEKYRRRLSSRVQ